VVDIGGQDSKAIAIDHDGIVEDFAMNDRCASGTGRFFEVLARAVECEIDELADLALAGHRELEVSSMCATFAETELISMLAQGERREDIAASVHRAVATRTVGLVAQVGRRSPILMTGGVARNAAAVHAFAEGMGADVRVPESPQTIGAHGAALLARDGAARAGRGAGETAVDVREPARSCSSCETTLTIGGLR
jgi:predicted CoA-substrate-specific enzyme activase